jgi:hypothetical protein
MVHDKKGLVMELNLLPRGRINLVTCALCLRVRRGSAWVDAETVIRELRSFDRALPHLRPGVCDDCLAEVYVRRVPAEEAIAA